VPILREVSTNLDNQVERISGNDGDYTVAAKHIYTYIRENFTCTPDDDINLGIIYTVSIKRREAAWKT